MLEDDGNDEDYDDRKYFQVFKLGTEEMRY